MTVWNGKERRKEQKQVKRDRREHVGFIPESSEIYQLEQGIRVIFRSDFNVWHVLDSRRPSYKTIIYEVVGMGNKMIAFEFAQLAVKKRKYGLSQEEEERYSEMKGEHNENGNGRSDKNESESSFSV